MKKLFSIIGKIIRNNTRWSIGLLAVGLTYSITMVGYTALLQRFIDMILVKLKVSSLTVLMVLFATVTLITVVSTVIKTVLQEKIRQKTIYVKRMSFLKTIVHAVYDKLVRWSPGELVNAYSMCDRYGEIISEFFENVFEDSIAFVFVIVYLMILNWKMALFAIAGTIFTSVAQMLITKYAERYSELQVQVEQNVSGMVEEFTNNIQQIKTMNVGDYMLEKVDRPLTDLAKKTIKYTLKTKVIDQTSYMLFELLKLCIYVMGGYEVSRGNLTPGGFMAFYSYLGWLDYSFGVFWKLSVHFSELSASISIVENIERLPQDVFKQTDVNRLDHITMKPGLCLAGIGFSYEGDSGFSLENINMEVKDGEPVIIYGPSGSGKTTLMNVIMGFLKAEAGSITVDGNDISCLSPEERGTFISYVPQNAMLFSDTIRNLISVGKDISEQKILSYLHIVGLDEFVDSLPERLDTQISRKTTMLSTGQLHRICIAQALAMERRVLILDEPTANLDEYTKNIMLARIKDWAKDKLLLYVMHDYKDVPGKNRLIDLSKMV